MMADLAVAEDCRGKGVARKLVEALEESVRKWGALVVKQFRKRFLGVAFGG